MRDMKMDDITTIRKFTLWMFKQPQAEEILANSPILRQVYDEIKRGTLNKRQRLKRVAMRKGRK
jgi:hypothetical protein